MRYQNWRALLLYMFLGISVLSLFGLPGGVSSAQTAHPKRASASTAGPVNVAPVPTQGPTLVETIDFIKSKIRRDTSETLFACNSGYFLVQMLFGYQIEQAKPPQDQEVFVELHHWPVVGSHECDNDIVWTGGVNSTGHFHPSKIAIGSITITQDWLASYRGRHIEDFYVVDIPLASPEPNLITTTKSGKVEATHLNFFLPDQQTAERVKNAVIGLAKLCGAKEEAY